MVVLGGWGGGLGARMVGMAGNAEESSLSPSSQGVFKRFHLFLFENVPMLVGKPDRDKCHVIYVFI